MPRLKKLKIDPNWSMEELVKKRQEAAEEVCWTLVLMMSFGMLDIPEADREFLAKTFSTWNDLAFYIKDREEAWQTLAKGYALRETLATYLFKDIAANYVSSSTSIDIS